MFQRTELYWQQPGYDEPTDDDFDELVGEFEDDDLEFDDDESEFFERDGVQFCNACGILACPGEEEFDWCDHRTGADCYHMSESVFADDDDDEWDDGRDD